MALAKRSTNSYNFLKKFLHFPSIVTLNSELSKIDLQAGCRTLILQYLTEVSRNMHDEKEKYVVLIWDEMHLQAYLYYEKRHDIIIGFEDWGHRRTMKIADHAIVFYIRSISTGNKIPIGYGFCNSGTNTYQLVRCIKEYLCHIIESGLIPVATICDQHATNIAAINALIKENKNGHTSKYSHLFII